MTKSNNKTKPTPARCKLFASALFYIAVCAQSAWADGQATEPTILVVGDSISAGYGIQREQGWVTLLQKAFLADELAWQVTNASVSGETTGGGLARLPELLATHTPALVLIELGGNDGLRGYPVEKMRQNLLDMVNLVKQSEAEPVIMAMRIPPNYGPRYTRQFDGVFAEIAEQTESQLIPFFLNDIALEPGMMQSDGIHPTAEAQPIMARVVQEALTARLAN